MTSIESAFDEVQDPYAARHLEAVRRQLSSSSAKLSRLRRRNRYFRSEINRLIQAQVPAGSEVLDVGCGAGDTLAALSPRRGVGIDIDAVAISEARSAHPDLDLRELAIEESSAISGTFEFVVAAGLLEHTYDVYVSLRLLKARCEPTSRVIVVTYTRLWQPAFRLAERMGLKSSFPVQNWVPVNELRNLAEQAGFEVVKSNRGVLVPLRIPLVSRWANRWLSQVPIIKHLDFVHVTVLRPAPQPSPVGSVTVVVPARNESGHIAEILDRLPKLAEQQEVIFIEGNSTDDTWDTIVRECDARRPEYHSALVCMKQPGKGKGDAVRAAFAEAHGDVLMILDADISVPPEELPKFVTAIRTGQAEFANGSRLVYDMEGGAMRFLNLLGNRFFGALFSFLLNQPVRDTLCGTKVLRREHYEQIAANRARFGDFDPFGDFDLLFGASGLNLKIRDVPVHYKARTYGDTNISRFRHGVLLLRMSWVAARRLRFV